MPKRRERQTRWLAVGLVGLLLLAACTPVIPEGDPPQTATERPDGTVGQVTDTPNVTTTSSRTEREYEIITLLPPDAIPAIDDPQFYDVIGAELEYDPSELVLGVEVDGEARAYPVGLLAQHEIVNDTVGGQPIAVTY